VDPADRDLAELAADPANPRTISDEALAGLEVSVRDFGDLSGIVFNRRTQQLVTGHQRLTTLMRAGAKTWAHTDPSGGRGVIVHPETGEAFPVRIVDWDEASQRRANLVANSPAIAGEFTAAALDQLRALEDDAAFTALRLDALMEAIAEDHPNHGGGPAGDPGDEDDVPEPPAEPITRPGDLWILGEHRLYCGNSQDADDVLKLINGERPALGLHDPPYGIGIQNIDGSVGGPKAFRGTSRVIAAKAYPTIAGDDRAFDPEHLLSTGDAVVIWGANHFAHLLPPSAAWIVWDKRVDMEPNNFSDAELAWVSTGGSVRIFRFLFSGIVRDGKAEDGPVRVHPTQKPIALYRWIIEEKTDPGALVYDAYGGSGPTLLACEKLGRRARVMELAPAYVDVICRRWATLTGKRPYRNDDPADEFPL
jgi:hypothetical protein